MDEGEEMTKIVKFPLINDRLTPAMVIDEARGETWENLCVIGYNDKGHLRIVPSDMRNDHLLWLAKMLELAAVDLLDARNKGE